MIKNQLKHILIDKDMSLNQLADETGITYSMIYDFANMKRQSVKFETIEAICKLLQVTPGDLLTYESISFYEWLQNQVDRDDLVGDLAKDALRSSEREESANRANTFEAWNNRLRTTAAHEAFKIAWKEYEAQR